MYVFVCFSDDSGGLREGNSKDLDKMKRRGGDVIPADAVETGPTFLEHLKKKRKRNCHPLFV